MRKRSTEGKGGSKWEEERKKFFKDRGQGAEEVERRRDEGDIWFGELINKDREQRLERWQRKEESRYNRWYKVIKKEKIPEYLKKNEGKANGEE